MMTELLELRDMESDDSELVPEILPVESRLSIEGNASVLSLLFASANTIAPVKAILPNTDYVLLESFDATAKHVSHIQVSATDGERAITLIDDSFTIRMAGQVLVPGRRVAEILKMVPDETVRIDVIGTIATIRSGPAVWSVATPSSDATLPAFADIDEMKFYPVAREDILQALELTYPAVAKTTARHSLMQAEILKGNLTACDGVRAHRVSVPGLDKALKTTLPLSFIVTAIKELRAFDGETIEIGSNHSTVVFHFGKNILRSQRLNYTFPEVDHLVLGPALQNDQKLTVEVSELADVVRRVRINADPDFSALFLSLRQVKGTWSLTVHARDKQGNSSQETVPCEYVGPDASKDLVVNHKYFLDFLACLSTKAVTFKLGETTKLKQSPIYAAVENFTGSLMPMSPSHVK